VAKLVGATPEQIRRQDVLKVRQRVTLKGHGDSVVVSKWPRRRGPVKSPRQQAWVDRFACMAQAFSSPEPRTRDAAEMWAKGTPIPSAGPIKGSGWFYRDVLVRAAGGDLITFQEETHIKTPTVYVSRNAGEALTQNIAKALTPNVETWDNNSFWTASLNPTRITFRSPGLYAVGFSMNFTPKSGSWRAGWVVKNGILELANQGIWPNAATPAQLAGSTIMYFAANDYIEVWTITNTTAISATLTSAWAVAITPEALIP